MIKKLLRDENTFLSRKVKKGLLLLLGESILLFCDHVQMEFAGQDGPEFKGGPVHCCHI
jgi:hypothetical protein